MKIRQQVFNDLISIIQSERYVASTDPVEFATERLRAHGWEVTRDTLLDTARGLGFIVIGVRIYHPDD